MTWALPSERFILRWKSSNLKVDRTIHSTVHLARKVPVPPSSTLTAEPLMLRDEIKVLLKLGDIVSTIHVESDL